jgi:GT2 family glycosyltransferase
VRFCEVSKENGPIGTVSSPTSRLDAAARPGTDVTVAVFVINWNGGSLLKRCLQSLLTQRRPADRVIVVDNASTDDSLDLAASELRSAQLVRLKVNEGFARANNIAATVAPDVDAFALLNPDAFADPGWLEALVRAADASGPDVAAFTSQMRFDSDPSRLDGAGDAYHVSGRAWRAGHRKPVADWPARDDEVFAACAAAALYRREAFQFVGGFDERYFAYFEDVDLGFRLRLQGYRCRYVHDSIVRHVSSGLSGYRSDVAVYYGERNMVWTFFRNMPGTLFWRYLPEHLLLNLVSLLYYPLRGQGLTVWKAKWDALKELPTALRQRQEIQRRRVATDQEIQNSLTHGLLTPYLRRYT